MIDIIGLNGIRPTQEIIKDFTCPPYDVIKPGTPLGLFLSNNPDSLYHIILGNEPELALKNFLETNKLVEDSKPCYYIYEQTYGEQQRTGILAAVEVSDYSEGKIIRHEKTFNDKVKGRLELSRKTGFTFEPIFLLTKAPISSILTEIKKSIEPFYEFTSDFANLSDLHNIKNKIYRVEEKSKFGLRLKEAIGNKSLYIADGHHRYHAALINNQTHCLAYICEQAAIQAYNRVINGLKPFSSIKDELNLRKVTQFQTPLKHQFCIYTRDGIYELNARNIPDDIVGKLDCSILEQELYPLLGLTHSMIKEIKHFDYYPETELEKMKHCVDTGKYDLAVALHPVSLEELMAVAEAGLKNTNIVMPEKSTYFAPKILSGIFIYRHKLK
ncbi:DUF1015 domain-containing protein [Bacillota bacterium LX-D]|nr:DUF1015 domain-containing protein [Bacillota bacterium LX-D]